MITTPTHDQIGSLVPLEKGRDYAVEAEDQVRLLGINDDLHKFFLKLFEKKKQDEAQWTEIKRGWVRARNYFDGRQFGRVTNSYQWVDFELRPGEQTFMDNIYHPHVQTAMMELSRGHTELSFSYIVKESRHGELVARIAEQLYQAHRRSTFGSLKTTQENLSLLLNGIALRYTYWNKNGRKEKIPVFSERSIGGDAVSVCAYCEAPMKDRCSYCGSTDTKQLGSGDLQTKAVSGYEDVERGECEWISVDPLGVTFYLQAPELKDSPYLIWEQNIITEVLQSEYPDIRISDGNDSREMEMKDSLGQSSPHDRFFADESASDRYTAEFTQGWFDPPLYATRIIKTDTKLRNGMVLKADTRLGEYFPDGLYLAKNEKNILDVWNEKKCDKWCAAPYVTRPGTLVGAGTSIALANQDIKNDLRNLHMKGIFNDAFAKEFVNAQYLEGENVPDDPNERAMVVGLPPGERIVGTVIDRLPPASLAPDAYALEERIDASMQLQLGTFSGASSDPMPDAAQNTATGFLTWRNMTVGRYAPMLSARADGLDKEQAYQFLQYDQLYMTASDWAKMKGDFGAEAVQAFLKCDLRKELVIEVVGESFMPTSLTDRRAKTSAFVEMTVQAQIPPDSEMGAFIGEQFDMPKSLVGFNAHKSIAYEMIFAFKSVADQIVSNLEDIPSFDARRDPVAMQIGQLIVQQANKPVDATMDDIAAITDTLKDWWITDEGRSSSNALKAAVLVRVMEMELAMVEKMQADQQLAMAAQAPMMQMQAEQQQAQAEASEAEAQRAAEEKEIDLTARATEKVMDAEAREQEMAFQSAESEKQRNHEMAMAAIQQKAQSPAR